MKKLLALMICIVLLASSAAAEGVKRQPRSLTGKNGLKPAVVQEEAAEPEAAEAVPGSRLTVDQISVTIGEETFESDLRLNVDAGLDDAGEFGSFFAELGGVRLLPVSVQMDDKGMSMKLGNSSVYCFTPAALGMEDMMVVEELPAAEGARPPHVELTYGFVEYLDGFEGENFEIEPLELMAWLEEKLYLEQGSLRQWAAGMELPLITAERETLGYTIAVGGEEPMYFTLRDSERHVSIMCADLGMSMLVGSDSTLQFSLNTGMQWEGYADEMTSVTAQYSPSEDGTGKYSLVYDYSIDYKEQLYADLSEKQRLTVYGASDADGVHDVKATYCEDYAGIDDLSASLHIGVQPAMIENPIAGQTPVMIESETDSSMSSIAFAAMGLLSDIERLMNDPAIGGIIAAYEAQSEQYYDVYMRGFEQDYVGMTTIEAPEFGWMPEGTVFVDLDVSENYVQYEYELEGGKVYISLEAPNDMEKKSMEEDEAAGESPLTYRSEGSFFTAAIVEEGVETKIYSYDVVLTEAEVRQILDSRVWIGEGYDDKSNVNM